MSTAPTARDIARADMTERIKTIARAHLASDGPDLSLRAVARELGVVSSAVYRYFASRDELLTALIIDGYDSMGEAAERADAAVPRRDLMGRWMALGRAARAWSRDRPAEYALLYGTPIPGYAAPQDTVPSAQRVLLVAVGVVRDGVEKGVVPTPADRLPKAVRADFARVASYPGFEGLPPTVLGRLMSVWAQLFGTLSFELFGRYTGAVLDLDAFFEHELRTMARHIGLL
ncbi:TetR/AcrR family transcriptional regulator [uncultured Jatrophihabitans sp.]|uniref:TetR/AcrR family transcriptional regulator n=1 Tax=uncultured Jatrophihabitans sp. TaxID=1610747 RepID=UPI0035CA0745